MTQEMRSRRIKTLYMFDLRDHFDHFLEDIDDEMIEIQVMAKDGSFWKIYELHLVEFFKETNSYQPVFKVVLKGAICHQKTTP